MFVIDYIYIYTRVYNYKSTIKPSYGSPSSKLT